MKQAIIIGLDIDSESNINISQSDLMSIQNEVLNQLKLVIPNMEGKVEIDAKVKSINEEELNELSWDYLNTIFIPCRYEDTAREAFKAGYRKAILNDQTQKDRKV